MSTENAMSLDQAVEAFMAVEEPVQTEESSAIMEDDIATNDVETTEDDSDVDYSDDEESDENDTDEEFAEDNDEPDQSEPSKFTVKVDGEELEVTLEDLKRSFAGQGKIQKGMQAAAEARKQAEAIQQQMAAAAQQLQAMYQQVQQQGFIAPPKEPSRELFDSDPIGYMEAKMQYEDKLKAFNEQQAQMTQLQQQQMQQQQAQQQQMLQSEVEALRQKIPELSNPEKADRFRADLVSTASEYYGYSPEDLSGVTDHRALMVLRDAMMWRKSQKGRSKVDEKAKKARPVIKPQAKRTADPKRVQVQKSKAQLKKSGSVEDALALMFQ